MRHLLRVCLLLISGFSLGKEIDKCCKRKIVGNDIYNVIKEDGEAKSQFGCKNDCVYSIEGKPDSMFCFRSGDQQAGCQDSTDSTNSTDSIDLSDETECIGEPRDDDLLLCADGKTGVLWDGCVDRGSTRVQCPKGYYPCNQLKANGKVFHCDTSCDGYGGKRDCRG